MLSCTTKKCQNWHFLVVMAWRHELNLRKRIRDASRYAYIHYYLMMTKIKPKSVIRDFSMQKVRI